MASRVIADDDDFEWTDQRFLNPPGGNVSISDSKTRTLMATDPEKFPTFLSQLPTPPQNSNDDEIITALGRPVSGLELVRLAQSAIRSSEGGISKDVSFV
jgi:hypothetical protein